VGARAGGLVLTQSEGVLALLWEEGLLLLVKRRTERDVLVEVAFVEVGVLELKLNEGLSFEGCVREQLPKVRSAEEGLLVVPVVD